jgi:hypothetical protein
MRDADSRFTLNALLVACKILHISMTREYRVFCSRGRMLLVGMWPQQSAFVKHFSTYSTLERTISRVVPLLTILEECEAHKVLGDLVGGLQDSASPSSASKFSQVQVRNFCNNLSNIVPNISGVERVVGACAEPSPPEVALEMNREETAASYG